jgi:exoribonuclease R
MKGQIVSSRRISIVESDGERYYLPSKMAEGYYVGDSIKFETIIDDKPLRRIGKVISEPPPRKQTNNEKMTTLFEKYQLIHEDPLDLTSLDTFTVIESGKIGVSNAFSIDNSHIYIHVTFFQLPQNLEDRVYQQNRTIYLPEATYHLLPLPLVAKKYSLLKDKIRLTWTVQFDREMTFQNVYLAYIQNKHEFTDHEYDSLMDPLYKIYKKYEDKLFTAPEYYYEIVNEKLIDIRKKEYSETRKMKNCFMVATNASIGRYLKDNDLSFPHRSHDFVTKPTEISKEIDAHLKVIKSAKAYYTAKDHHHAFLNLNVYTHFTDPLRRYTDQVVSKILHGEIYKEKQLQKICTQSNVQEEKIKTINEEYLESKLKDYLKEHPIQSGVIISLSDSHLEVLLMKFKMIVKLPVDKLVAKNGQFKYNDGQLIMKVSFERGDEIPRCGATSVSHLGCGATSVSHLGILDAK